MTSADISIYPEQETVRGELAKYFRVTETEVLLTNGTDEALHLISNVFVEPRDAVLLAEPTFAMYRFYSELAGARVRALRYDELLRFPMKQVVKELRRHPRDSFSPIPTTRPGAFWPSETSARFWSQPRKRCSSWMKPISNIQELRFCPGYAATRISSLPNFLEGGRSRWLAARLRLRPSRRRVAYAKSAIALPGERGRAPSRSRRD